MFDDKLDSINTPPEDKLPIWIRVLFFVFPILGFIYFFANRKSSPEKAKMAGQIGLLGLVFGLVLNLIMSAP